jgi:hypothetical protein
VTGTARKWLARFIGFSIRKAAARLPQSKDPM